MGAHDACQAEWGRSYDYLYLAIYIIFRGLLIKKLRKIKVLYGFSKLVSMIRNVKNLLIIILFCTEYICNITINTACDMSSWRHR